MRSVDVLCEGKRNTTATTPERPRVPQLSLRQLLTNPIALAAVRPLKASVRGDGEKQEKAPALLPRRCGHNRPQCGRFQGRRLTLF